MAKRMSGLGYLDDRGRISLTKYTDKKMFQIMVMPNGVIELSPVILVSKNGEDITGDLVPEVEPTVVLTEEERVF